MAGDWIKMRGNLWDDPRVAKLSDLTNTNEAMVIGSLYWLWATADQHTEDGIMPDLSTRAIDRKTGLAGFASALISIGWLEVNGDGVQIPEFEKHNGTSAKKRLDNAKRVANFRANNDENKQENGSCNETALQKRTSALTREEKRREEREKTGGERGRARAPEVGGQSASPHPPIFSDEDRDFCKTERPDLDPDRTRASFCDHYAIEKQTTANWRKWVRREVRGPVAGVDLETAAAVSDPDSRASIEALGLAVGFGRWDQLIEPWTTYKTRVKSAQFQQQKEPQCH
jgi:hypothetical protein